ncbi:FadR/GntR family transcriptional regulator [Pseudoroseicyclus tamaricis]|uniref:FadR family transcriptional regulator n=1 Tax=Pseudoroseicyclus tamaricis TaxID=2705421 RepID=A0A6B2JP19_9RHOB|nr:FadR/GntR family transcriptional regulator [Pseudoroseicyclus tamaricis]NDU99739.1 FadR family transcriptional regulator [Pseudoroseicyclus tamaricis]
MGGTQPEPLYRRVSSRIAAMIRAGEWAPGERMPPDRELTERLGVSRATVREAMIALEVQGLVETRFGHGARVAATLPEEAAPGAAPAPGFFELVEARMQVEGLIAGLAATRLTEQGLSHLRALAEGVMRPGLSLEEIAGLDRAFHVTLAAATGNSVLTGLVEDFWRQRARFPDWARAHNFTTDADVARYIRDEHLAITEALAAGDAEGARARMQLHCQNFGASLLENWHLFEESEEPPPEIAALFRP